MSTQVIDELFSVLEQSANSEYYGEAVSQLEHALQAADSARRAGADDEMVIAALLHDIGHLIAPPDARSHEGVGVADHDDIGAAYLRERGFSPRVVALVGGHVDAKRYLTATNPDYKARLSPASTKTLELQGGPLTTIEADAFRNDELFREKLQLRSWDEQGKIPGAVVPSLAAYRELIETHLARTSR